jgi:hypothetical protein
VQSIAMFEQQLAIQVLVTELLRHSTQLQDILSDEW